MTRDIEQDNPGKNFSPRYVPVNSTLSSWKSTSGSYSYCLVGGTFGKFPNPGATCAPTPVAGSSYRFDLATRTNGSDMWLDENYWQNSTNPVYARRVIYATAGFGRSLKSFSDSLTAGGPRGYQRFTGVSAGACYGPI